MLTLGEYITEKFKISKDIKNDVEKTTEKDIKDAVKKTGFKLSAIFKFDPNTLSLRYSKKGGHAGGDTINNFVDLLKYDLDWKEVESKDKVSQMSGSVDYLGTLYSPDKEVLFKYSRYYGSTSRENTFNAEFLLVKDEEERLTKLQNLQNMKKVLKELGENYPTIEDFENLNTFKIRHMFKSNLEKVQSSWKKVDENTYEKDDFVFTVIPAEKEWDNQYFLSFKNEPEMVKIIK